MLRCARRRGPLRLLTITRISKGPAFFFQSAPLRFRCRPLSPGSPVFVLHHICSSKHACWRIHFEVHAEKSEKASMSKACFESESFLFFFFFFLCTVLVNNLHSLFWAVVVVVLVWRVNLCSCKIECVTDCTTIVEMVHCHPLPRLPLYPCSLLASSSRPGPGLQCVRVCGHDVIANCSGLSGC